MAGKFKDSWLGEQADKVVDLGVDLALGSQESRQATANAQAAYAQSQAAAAAASAEKAETRKLMMFGGGLLGLVGLVALARR